MTPKSQRLTSFYIQIPSSEAPNGSSTEPVRISKHNQIGMVKEFL
jgi:hypothetical protein